LHIISKLVLLDHVILKNHLTSNESEAIFSISEAYSLQNILYPL
jgi:hypothetical protein